MECKAPLSRGHGAWENVASVSCFDEITARALAAGQLHASESNPLRRHAEGCRKCAQLLARVTPPGAAAQRTAVAQEISTDTSTLTAGRGDDDTLPTEPIRVENRPTARAPSPSSPSGSKPSERPARPAIRQTGLATHLDRHPNATVPTDEARPPEPAAPHRPAAPVSIPAPAGLAAPPAPPPPEIRSIPPPAPPQDLSARILPNAHAAPGPSASPKSFAGAHVLPHGGRLLSAPDAAEGRGSRVTLSMPLAPSPAKPLLASPGGGKSGRPPARKDVEDTEPRDSAQIRVGRYHILDTLGAGGMGAVYSAYDPELHRRVAIKLLHPDANPAARSDGSSRLLREAQAMARLSHPNVVSVYDAGTFAGRVFIAMERVDGLSLRHWLRAEHRTWREVLDIFRQAGRGLAAAHAAGLVHRDFKPANVLVSKDGRAQVTDFGLARTTADLDAAEAGRGTTPALPRLAPEDLLQTALTEAGLVMGTPAYMPPEQHEDGRIDARGDQFSFCASLYEALYGQLPFNGKRPEDYLEEARAGRVRPPPRGSRVPTWVLRAVTRGLSPAPEARFPSMGVLLDALGADPLAAWRRRGAVAAASMLLNSVVAVTWLLVGSQRDGPCPDAEARLTGVWDTARRAEIQKAFAATGKVHASAAFERVATTLDGFARDWTRMHREACEATRVQGHQSDHELALRMACLDRRHSALVALTGVLAQTDAEALNAAPDAAQRLPPIAACADVDALWRGLSEPEGQRQQVEALRARVDRATALVDAGRYPQAQEEAKAVLSEARQLGYGPVLAEALELEGRLGLVAGDDARAAAALRESLFTAQAHRHDHLAARASARLVTAVSSDPTLESWTVEQARASIQRAGGASELEALLQTSLGRNAFLRGQYAQAVEAFGRSATLREQELGPEHLLTLESLRNQAAALSRTPETERAMGLLHRVLETTERVLGPDHPQTAMAANAMGYHLVIVRRFEEALPYLQRAIHLEEQSLGHDSATLSYPLNNLAEALEALGRNAEARPLRERALAVDLKAYGPEHPETATDLALLGALALREGKPRDAMDYARRSIAAYEAFQKDHLDTAAPLTTLGLALHALGKSHEARAMLERALALRTAHPGPAEDLASTRFALAQTLVKQDGPRARGLANQALHFYAAEEPTYAMEASSVRNWLQDLRRRRR
ncbi:serine/threonine kinase family protein [Myxococcus xanthus DK 1622]|uniref:Serine/threonine kinase family protein n=2 Tax=Myxococcus xanthus TaxID=34 RepID=Q1DC86_MYXXD|nr:serine/threonine kinase family protein [Myxococcus xanthus DK 1622]QPM81118.1 serine/threonine protein kinase [Myxococcus xanthus]QVW70177.1 serine/threonine protein kinase [Myxococcus xanthus DZ2]UEO03693.1 serine/threonine-protein kinase [Myxococcus xanthus DZ2]